MTKILTRAEEFVLLTIWTLQRNAYSLQIQTELERVSGKKWSLGTIYGPLERLEKRKMITSSLSESTPAKGGRQKRIYTLTNYGKNALLEIQEMSMSIWSKIPELKIEIKV